MDEDEDRKERWARAESLMEEAIHAIGHRGIDEPDNDSRAVCVAWVVVAAWRDEAGDNWITRLGPYEQPEWISKGLLQAGVEHSSHYEED